MAELTRLPVTAARPAAVTATIQLLIVDEHPLVRWALAHIARDAPDLQTVGEASNAVDAMRLALTAKPDVVTIDCSLPDETGWQLARDLPASNLPAPAIVARAPSSSPVFSKCCRSRRTPSQQPKRTDACWLTSTDAERSAAPHDLMIAATAVATKRTILNTDRTAQFDALPGVECLVAG